MRSLFLSLILILTISLHSQEYVKPLTQDLSRSADTEARLIRASNQRSGVTSVSLPFIDDFSQDHLLGNEFNYEVLWEELDVIRHADFGVDAPSIGVAVFDGLNANGAPYDSNSSNSNGLADSLTSMDLDLSGTSNVVLSFFYQPAGRGDSPESNDSLILQFFDPSENAWSRVWNATGTPLTAFVPVYLSVADEYLENGFRFRFMNYGRLTGALDQWALDWVYLDANRSLEETGLTDVGFFSPITSLLNGNRTAIPWEHYLASDQGSLMITQVDAVIRNNRDANALISQPGYKVFYDGSLVDEFTDSQAPSVEAMSNLAITQEIALTPNFFVYPDDVNDTMATFDVEFNFNTNPDLHADNNILRVKQIFKDYYAYDDGQADIAYGIQNFNGAGKVGLEYTVLQEDTLIAVDMQFLYQAAEGTDLEDQLFYLTVWEKTTTDTPGEEIYQDLQPRMVEFASDGGYVRYMLQDTLVLDANEQYFFGWVQPDNISLNIGSDLSANLNTDKLFFDVGFGWQPSSYPGVIMLRPVFPSKIEAQPPVGIGENSFSNYSIWPNPAKGQLNITGEFPIGTIATLYDLEGRIVTYERLNPSFTRMDLGFTSEGLYILELASPAGIRSIEKIVISR
jgi:hypothetical protein